ncbi:hypothetical protein Bca4012_056229 [Brassica carinata]
MYCRGSGVVEATKTVEVVIPGGLSEGLGVESEATVPIQGHFGRQSCGANTIREERDKSKIQLHELRTSACYTLEEFAKEEINSELSGSAEGSW